MGKHRVTRKKRSQMRKYKKKSRRQGGFFGCTGASCSAGVAEQPDRANKAINSEAISNEQYKKVMAEHNKREKNRKEAFARLDQVLEQGRKDIAERKPPQISLSNIPTRTFSR